MSAALLARCKQAEAALAAALARAERAEAERDAALTAMDDARAAWADIMLDRGAVHGLDGFAVARLDAAVAPAPGTVITFAPSCPHCGRTCEPALRCPSGCGWHLAPVATAGGAV